MTPVGAPAFSTGCEEGNFQGLLNIHIDVFIWVVIIHLVLPEGCFRLIPVQLDYDKRMLDLCFRRLLVRTIEFVLTQIIEGVRKIVIRVFRWFRVLAQRQDSEYRVNAGISEVPAALSNLATDAL